MPFDPTEALWIQFTPREIEALHLLIAAGAAHADDQTQTAAALVRAKLEHFQSDDLHDALYFAEAKNEEEEGHLEIDPNAVISASDDGAYVMAWLWVPRPESLADDHDDDDEDNICLALDCANTLDNGEGYDGFCGSCADRMEQHRTPA